MSQQQPPPPQPETIIIECSGANSIRQTDQNDEWEVSIPPTIIEKGDEISVNQSFLEARGTSTEILEFSSSGLNQNNSQKIYFEYYANDCGTNDMNKGRDWNNFQFPIATGLHESGKTYKPNQAFRYDRLLDNSTIFANGNGFQRTVRGVQYESIKPTAADPRVANAYAIDFREDYNVAGVFNSFNAIKEVTAVNPTSYIGETFEIAIAPTPRSGVRTDQQNPNRKDLTLEQMSMTVSDWCINLDAMPYFEMQQNITTGNVDIMIPHTEANTNYLASIPRGTCIWIDYAPKRRQMSFYTGANKETDAEFSAGGGAAVPGSALGANGGYRNYNEISNRTQFIKGHFVVYDNNVEGTFFDNASTPSGGGNTDPRGNVNTDYGFAGKKCIGIRFRGGYDSTEHPGINNRVPFVGFAHHWTQTRGGITYSILNPNTTLGKTDLNTATVSEAIAINLFIRKSPFYVGSADGQLFDEFNIELGTFPAAAPGNALEFNKGEYDLTRDASFGFLFPKDPAHPTTVTPYFVGCAKKINTDITQPFQKTDASNPSQDQQFAVLSGDNLNQSPISLVDYSTWNATTPYAPHGFNNEYTLQEPLLGGSTTLTMNFIAPATFGEKLIMPEANIVVIARGTEYEEYIALDRLDDQSMNGTGNASIFLSTDPTFPKPYVNNPDRMRFVISQRNLTQNRRLFIGATSFDVPEFSRQYPASWITKKAAPTPPATSPVEQPFDVYEHPPGTTMEWWDFREGLTQSICINHENYHKALPEGLPILKDTGYWGVNEPSLNDDFPATYTDGGFYTALLNQNYSTGFSYFLYYNRFAANGGLDSINTLADSVYRADMVNSESGQFGINRGGVPMLMLTEAIDQTSHQTTTSLSAEGIEVPESPTLTQQVRASSTSTYALTGTKQFYALFNPHEYVWNMRFTEKWESGMLNVNPDMNASETTSLPAPGTVQFTHTTHSRNFYVFSPDSFDMINFSDKTLKHVTKQGINSYCGYIPYINSVEVETPKDYMTPDDLSNFWTEQLHKAKDIVCLLDGTTLKGSAARGLIQNECLSAIYGSWGKNNQPTPNGLARDGVTFPFTNGYALGSVIFIDGHKQPNDWNYTGTNKDFPTTMADINFPIYPRSPESLIHLWGQNEPFQLPEYTQQFQTVWDNAGVIQTSATLRPIVKYFYGSYPVAPSGICDNTATSYVLPADGEGFTNVLPTSANYNPKLKANLNYVSTAPIVPGTADKGNKSVQAYSLVPEVDPYLPPAGTATGDLYGLWCAPGDLDQPFSGADNPDGGQREDPIYRETSVYPLEYYKDAARFRYLQFSQYVGSDNFTLTFNTEVSAFEYQFLHQPFATTFSLDGGVESGGDNAVRVFDNIPDELDNWEKYSGLNVRNWATPLLERGEFNFNDIQNTPAFISQLYPGGINPETDMDSTGDAFMSKLGYTEAQYDPRIGSLVKGTIGIGADASRPQSYAYVPNGTTGADIDVADAIINTSFAAEDNPDAEAHGGVGQLMFYPSSIDDNKNQLSTSGVRYDYSFTQFGQRGGLKTNSHNKAMGFPNLVGTPAVKDTQTFPRTLNPDGEQRSGYTIEIGSSPIRAKNLPIKLTDGYYFILCPTLIDDPQFYISANNGSVIPAIAIVSKTYVSGDFYTTFQSPITFYAKKQKVITSIKIQIRNSSMGVPSNLGANSSVIFSIRRFAPTVYSTPLSTSQSQTLAYKQIEQEQKAMPKSHTSVLQDFLALGNAALVPDPEGADYLGGLVARINQQDIPNMTPEARRNFYATEAGQTLFREVQDTLGVQQTIQDQDDQPTGLQTIILQRQQEALAEAQQAREERSSRNVVAQANAERDPTAIVQPSPRTIRRRTSASMLAIQEAQEGEQPANPGRTRQLPPLPEGVEQEFSGLPVFLASGQQGLDMARVLQEGGFMQGKGGLGIAASTARIAADAEIGKGKADFSDSGLAQSTVPPSYKSRPPLYGMTGGGGSADGSDVTESSGVSVPEYTSEADSGAGSTGGAASGSGGSGSQGNQVTSGSGSEIASQGSDIASQGSEDPEV